MKSNTRGQNHGKHPEIFHHSALKSILNERNSLSRFKP